MSDDSSDITENCSANFLIADKGKINSTKKRASDKSCKKYDIDKCKLPDSVFYYTDDKNAVPHGYNEKYTFENITAKLEKIKGKNLNEKRCDCDYMVTLNWADKNGTSLWHRYKDYGFWKEGDGINDYLDSILEKNTDGNLTESSEKLKYEIMKLLCDATNTTDPRPESYKSAKSFFDSEKTLNVLDLIMGIISFIIIILASGTYKTYITKISGNNSFVWLLFMIVAISIWGINALGQGIENDDMVRWITIGGFGVFISLMIITAILSKVWKKTPFIWVSIIYIAFLIGTQLWLAFPYPRANKDTSGVFIFLAIVLEKTGLINKAMSLIFNNSIKTTSGPKWNVPFVPATIMLINWVLGLNKTSQDLKQDYRKKLKNIKNKNVDSFQIDSTIGDIGF